MIVEGTFATLAAAEESSTAATASAPTATATLPERAVCATAPGGGVVRRGTCVIGRARRTTVAAETGSLPGGTAQAAVEDHAGIRTGHGVLSVLPVFAGVPAGTGRGSLGTIATTEILAALTRATREHSGEFSDLQSQKCSPQHKGNRETPVEAAQAAMLDR